MESVEEGEAIALDTLSGTSAQVKTGTGTRIRVSRGPRVADRRKFD